MDYQKIFPLVKTINNEHDSFEIRRDSMGLKFPKDRGFIITSIHDTKKLYTNGKLIYKPVKVSLKESQRLSSKNTIVSPKRHEKH